MKSLSMIFIGLGLLFTQFSLGAVVKSDDLINSCHLYRITTKESPIKANEIEILKSEVYGFSVRNLEIDFTLQQVTVGVHMHIVLGLDRMLSQTRQRISATNPRAGFIINQLNRSINLFKTICISDDNEIIYAEIPQNGAAQPKDVLQ